MKSIVILGALEHSAVLLLLSTLAAAKNPSSCWNCFPGIVNIINWTRTKTINLRSTKPIFHMELIHVNDMHARFEQTNRLSGVCTPWEDENKMCFGGYARVATVINQAKEAEKKGEGPPVLALNAGDNFQGSMYYSVFKAEIVTKFVNMLNFDALTLGNHEFDDGLPQLEFYLRGIKKPIVAANVDISKCRQLKGVNLRPSVIVNVGGQNIGIIGYLTRETETNDVVITDEITAVKKEAKRLTKEGIKIVIALGHSGYAVDKLVALEVPEVDIVVGAHSHTFLYNEDGYALPDPSHKPKGSYPTIVTQSSGKKVPVIQAHAYTKYIGRLLITFDDTGEITSFKGNPLILDKNIPEDSDVLNELYIWKKKLEHYTNQVEGWTPILLDSTYCRQRECNIGNVVTDALIHSRAKTMQRKKIKGWTDAPIAVVVSGNIRSSIDARTRNNDVTLQDIMEAIPFENSIYLVKLKGDDLIEVLEHSVSQYDPKLTDNKGMFLQVSGLQVTYNINKPSGHRVERVLARCGECDVPRYDHLKNDQIYSVLMLSYMVNGADGYTTIRKKGDITPLTGDNEMAAVKRYFNEMSLICTEVGFRIILKK